MKTFASEIFIVPILSLKTHLKTNIMCWTSISSINVEIKRVQINYTFFNCQQASRN